MRSFALLAILALSAGIAHGESPTEQARRLLAEGCPADAIPLTHAAFLEAEGGHGPDAPETARALDLHVESLVAYRGGADPEVRALAERAVRLKEALFGPWHPEVAASLDRLARARDGAGDSLDAGPMFERALAIRERAFGPDSIEVAETLHGLGRHLGWTAGVPLRAGPVLERALAAREQALGPEHPDTAATAAVLVPVRFFGFGGARGRMQSLRRALAAQEASLGPDHPIVADTLQWQGWVAKYLVSVPRSHELFDRSLRIRRDRLDPDHPAIGVSRYLRIADSDPDRHARRVEARASLERTQGPRSPWLALATLDVGYFQGDWTDKLRLRRAAVAMMEEVSPDHFMLGWCLDRLASLVGGIGDTEKARQLWERAVALYERSGGPECLPLGNALGSLAGYRERDGDPEGALALHRRILEMWKKSAREHDPMLGLKQVTIANALRRLGRLDEALPLLESTAEAQLREHPDSPRVPGFMGAFAHALAEKGQVERGLEVMEQAHALDVKLCGPDAPCVAARKLGLAWLNRRAGHEAKAFDLALESDGMRRDRRLLLLSELPERQALIHAGSNAAPRELALSIAVEQHRRPTPAGTRRAWEAVMRSRAMVLDVMGARHRELSFGEDPSLGALVARFDASRQTLADLVVRGHGGKRGEAYLDRVAQAAAEREEAERSLADAGLEAPLRPGNVKLTDVAEALPRDAALVAYSRYWKTERPLATGGRVRGANAYCAFVLPAGGGDAILVPLGPATEIDAATTRWGDAVSRPPIARAREEDDHVHAASALRRLAWDPVAPHVADARLVLVVPDGVLHQVNLAALVDDAGSYLLESGPTFHVLSAERDVLDWRDDERGGSGLLAVGGPDYDATSVFASLRRAGEGLEPAMQLASLSPFRGERSACGDLVSLRFEPLPGASAEVREVAAVWKAGDGPGEVLHLAGAAASEAAFKAQAPGQAVLHVATHGFFLGGRCKSARQDARGIGGAAPAAESGRADASGPAIVGGENPLLLGGLALAGANRRKAAGADEEDGILTAEEIAALDLSSVRWAVLSACDTGVGEIRNGEGVLGLRRAFRLAGADTLITSLWAVEDEPTRAFMTALYDARLRRGPDDELDTPTCVREASLSVLEQRRLRGESAHPFYWGAFVASGDWR